MRVLAAVAVLAAIGMAIVIGTAAVAPSPLPVTRALAPVEAVARAAAPPPEAPPKERVVYLVHDLGTGGPPDRAVCVCEAPPTVGTTPKIRRAP